MKRDWKKLFNFLFIFATLAVVLLVGFNGQEMSGAVEALKAIGPGWIVLCLLSYSGNVAFDTLSLHYFLRRQGQEISFAYSLFVSVMGSYYCNITPGASGGQPMQVFYLSRKKIPVGIGASALTVKLFCFQFMLAVLGTVLWIAHGPFIAEQLGGNSWILIVGYAYNWFTVLLMIVLSFCHKPVELLIRFSVKLGVLLRICKNPDESRRKWKEVQASFHSCIQSLVKRPLDLLVQLVTGGVELMALMMVISFVYRAFHLSGVEWSKLTALGVMLYTSAAYTPLPGASGAQEGLFALYFASVFPDGIRVMALLVWRFFTYYMSLIVGAVVSVVHGFVSGKKKS